jgi:hypothetical protein
MTRIDELLLELNNYEKQMNSLWNYWDDVLRSWKMLERGRIIKKLQEEQIKEFWFKNN